MKTRFLLLTLVIFVWLPLSAQTKKALIIGINAYQPENGTSTAVNPAHRNFKNLNGCINDADAIADVVSSRYGFKQEEIVKLYDGLASRKGILAAFEKLIAESVRGDVVFIYYAGHGSQVLNSNSDEADGKDESIVPADAYLGVADIRDKELAALFNRFLDKGILLTVIFDSCHSGSAGRSLIGDPPDVRFIEASMVDAKDASHPQKPEARGALMIAAAQDFEYAKEQRDEHNIAHGLFTLALLKALQQLPADASVQTIFSSLNAIMNYYGKVQEPVLSGTAQRKEGTLFGLPLSGKKTAVSIAISKIGAGKIELQGGYLFGLVPGVKLKGLNTNEQLEVVEMVGANRCTAKLISGDISKLKPGILFKITSWARAVSPALNIYIPPAMEETLLETSASHFKTAAERAGLQVTGDISETPADYIFYYLNKGWILSGRDGSKFIGDAIAVQKIIPSLKGSIYFNLPPPIKWSGLLKKKMLSLGNIKIVDSPNDAQYSLTGKLNGQSKLSFAFVKSLITAQDSSGSLPGLTGFVLPGQSPAAVDESTELLASYVSRLAHIRQWLIMPLPMDDGSYPFKLSFKAYNSGKILQGDRVKIGDTLSVCFAAEAVKAGLMWNGVPRYVYVFSVDSQGAMNLLYPDKESGSVENRLPLKNALVNANLSVNLQDIIVTPPFGYDHYFMLSTDEPVNDLSVFTQEGVKGRGLEVDSLNWFIYKTGLRIRK